MTRPHTKLAASIRLHPTWRDSQGEINDAPLQAADAIDSLLTELDRFEIALRISRDTLLGVLPMVAELQAALETKQ